VSQLTWIHRLASNSPTSPWLSAKRSYSRVSDDLGRETVASEGPGGVGSLDGDLQDSRAEIVSKVLKTSRLRTVHEGVRGLWGKKMPSDWSCDRGNVASRAASFAWLVSGLPRSLAATWKREGEPTTMPLYMHVHNK
jgi:hypothetical protein